MNNEDISLQYRHFLRLKVDKYHLEQFTNVTVLGEFLLNDAYFVLAEGVKNKKFERCIIIENIATPVFSTFKIQPSQDHYITIKKEDLHRIVPPKLYKCLAKQGIATTIEIGMKRNKRFSWHRLVCCGYYNCLDKEVHHIDKNPCNNVITNLVPINKELHIQLDKDLENGYNLSKVLQYLELDRKRKKNTLAQNNELVLDILKMKTEGISAKDIVRNVRTKIKSSSVYKILKKYYYAEDFLKWLKKQSEQDNKELDGNFMKRWNEILKFNVL